MYTKYWLMDDVLVIVISAVYSLIGKDDQGAVGSLEELASFAEHTGKCWIASKNQLRPQIH
ncbi:hypothetical protein V6255_06145 [Psychromonas arctica]|uniref:Uncharacterized protein n=1 Tax=Psychromonas arctica TaxID=168275 RepID=A0ABU9HA93_9GAMM